MMIIAVVGSNEIFAAATYTSGVTAAQLAAQLQGPGLTITNPVLRRGESGQAGIFSNGIAGANLEVDEGIILTGMSVAEAFTTNSSWQTSINNPDITADANLLAIDSLARYDTVVFEFDVTLGANTRLLMVDYQFASEEYNEWTGTKFNDAFGFFVSGGDLNQTYNIARVVDDSTIVTTQNIGNYVPVTVNNVNIGSPGDYASQPGYAASIPPIYTNSQYFINNCVKGKDIPNCTQSKAPVEVEFDGLTHRLHATLDNLTPGVTYHFKMALADTGDSLWDTGVFVNKIMGIRGPQLCYDYAYKQNNRYITNKAYTGQTPRIDSYVLPGSDVEVSLFVKNIETSELTAQNLKMSVNDINTSQAVYSSNSVKVVLPNQVTTTAIADNTQGMTNSNSYIHNVPIGDFKSKEYYYLYYGLTPSVNDLNMSIDANLSFSLSVQGVTIPYNYKLGSDKLPICANTANYEPAYGIFNVAESELYTGAGKYYNLRTQVAKRAGNFKVISFEPTNLNQEKTLSTIAAVELIDAGAYHDTNTSCMEPSSAITPRIWLKWDNASQVTFDRASIDAAIADQRTSLPFARDFFKQARENAAFRVSYLTTNDGNNSLVKTSPGTPATNTKIDNFTQLVQSIGTCKQPVQINTSSANTTNQVAVACGNAGNQGINGWELRRCFECLYGYNTSYICSRDNFAIRPEALSVQMYDVNQTLTTQRAALPKITGIPEATVASPDMNLSAGYQYGFDINATNFYDSGAAPGYTRYFGMNDSDYNASFNWTPKVTATACNDTNNTTVRFNVIDGDALNNLNSHAEAGTYLLHLEDKTWTAVDNFNMAHHNGNSYFLSGADCAVNSNAIIAEGTDTGNGCLVNSGYLSSPNGLKYQDHKLTFRPHHFNMDSLNMSKGANFTALAANAIGQNIWVYMNNIATGTNPDENMSVRYFGPIVAQGKANNALRNFTENCYAEPVNLRVNLNFPITANLPAWRYRLQEINASKTWRDSNAVIVAPDTNASFPLVTLPRSSFLLEQNGTTDINLSINFDRNQTIAVNPILVGLQNFQVKCDVPTDCSSRAEMVASYLPDTNLTTNSTVNFVYGRVNPLSTTAYGTAQPISAQSYIEVYDTVPIILNAVALSPSKTGGNWWINASHISSDGNATVTVTNPVGHQPPLANNVLANGVTTYTGFTNLPAENALPFEFEAHIRTQPWLWYGANALLYSDPANPGNIDCMTHPCFNVKIRPTMTNWVGGGSDKGNKTQQNTAADPQLGEDMLVPRIRQ